MELWSMTEKVYLKMGPWLVWLSGLSASLLAKGRHLDSKLGHMSGLRARSPVGSA